MKKINKKTVLITGSGSGLGKDAAIALAKRGHRVIATTMYQEEADFLNDYSKENNIDLTSFTLNILDDNQRNSILNYDFDVLINNAAIGDSGSVAEIHIDRFKNVFETNVFSNIEITQIAIKKFMATKKGRIIFLSSLAGRITIPFLSPYCASKFAIESFASSLRSEMKLLKDVDIQVGIIEPGAYATGFNKENNEKKYVWMREKSYFKNMLWQIEKNEESMFNALEKKPFSSITKKYIHAVEDTRVKHRYSAPFFQAFFIQLGRVFGL